MTIPNKRAERIAEVWKVALAPILLFFLGAGVIVFDNIINPPGDPVSSGIGVVLLGLGPALGYDRVDRVVDALKGKE